MILPNRPCWSLTIMRISVRMFIRCYTQIIRWLKRQTVPKVSARLWSMFPTWSFPMWWCRVLMVLNVAADWKVSYRLVIFRLFCWLPVRWTNNVFRDMTVVRILIYPNRSVRSYWWHVSAIWSILIVVWSSSLVTGRRWRRKMSVTWTRIL